MSINTVEVSVYEYSDLLDCFPEAYREKLRLYTTEELFYVYKIMTLKPKRLPDGSLAPRDILALTIKSKLYRWLRGQDRHPVYPQAWAKLGSRFKAEFYATYVPLESIQD